MRQNKIFFRAVKTSLIVKARTQLVLAACALTWLIPGQYVQADEGMWQPHQLPEIKRDLKKRGLKLNPKRLTQLTDYPMGAVISLGGCSASFVSPEGLVITNHHCAHGSIQHNSTADNNLMALGFVARSRSAELPAAPGSRVYITESLTEVSEKVLAGIAPSLKGLGRYEAIEKNQKSLVSQCEEDSRYRCDVVSFHGGLNYYLIKKLAIRDVRLVYAPANAVGTFGGDVDNWMWPRHTGDFAFYRAYVDKDGKPSDYSESNVPYQPKHFLRLNASGVDVGDFIMAIGYPGRTSRYRTALEAQRVFEEVYPMSKKYREEIIDVIKQHSEEGSENRIKYESTIRRLANYAKNFESMIKFYQKNNMLASKQELARDLKKWILADETRKRQYLVVLRQLDNALELYFDDIHRDLFLSYMSYLKLNDSARRLYRLAQENKKPDEEREPGYQQRDAQRFEQRLKRVTRETDIQIEQQLMRYMLKAYLTLPEHARVASIDNYFGIDSKSPIEKYVKDEALAPQLLEKIRTMYSQTKLNNESERVAWMTKSVEEFKNAKDPLIRFAVSTFKELEKIEDRDKLLKGNLQAIRPKYMEVLLAYFEDQGKAVYADANSTLRVTYGTVRGYSPKDGLSAQPFTSLEGIVEKHSGKEPFNAPAKQLELIGQKQYGPYFYKKLGSVPVNFLGDLDITGGNSGSPVLDGRGNFVGIAFDGVYESIIGDWDYNDDNKRSIQVDVRYILWTMRYLDKANNLLDEMDIIQ